MFLGKKNNTSKDLEQRSENNCLGSGEHGVVE